MSGIRADILVDAGEFWPRLRADLAGARRRVLVQALTFEGDGAGLGLADALARSRAEDRRVLVDEYTEHMISDRFIHTPASRRDPDLQRELAATRRMFAELRSAGVGVRQTNPIGPLLLRFAARNHKKLVVVDEIAYIGGINFSDHNFAWHDFMLRREGPGCAGRVARVFEETCRGRIGRWSETFDGMTLMSLDGPSNARDFRVVLDAIARAERTILIESPYLTLPFFAPLRRAVRRGVQVSLIAPATNNKPVLNAYVRWEARRAGIRLHLYPDRMIHLKAMLLDDRELWIGSANFDFVSYRCEQEILCRVLESHLVAAFRDRVLEPDRARSPIHEGKTSSVAGVVGMAQLRLADLLIAGVERLTPRGSAGPSDPPAPC